MQDIGWPLSEPADVTLLYRDAELIETSFLIARVNAPGALVLTLSEDRVLVNGIYTNLGEDLILYCSLADEVVMAPGGGQVGKTVRVNPFR